MSSYDRIHVEQSSDPVDEAISLQIIPPFHGIQINV
jgi:hypothetical protein